MCEVTFERKIRRYAIITQRGSIYWDCDNLEVVKLVFDQIGGLNAFKGIYDNQEQKYVIWENAVMSKEVIVEEIACIISDTLFACHERATCDRATCPDCVAWAIYNQVVARLCECETNARK